MDALECRLVWVEGRCYRQLAPVAKGYQECESREDYSSERRLSQDDDSCDSNIEEKGTGSYSTSLAIPSSLLGVIIGAKGSTKSRIEQETKTRVSCPPHGKSGMTVITGRHKNGVAAARRQIKIIITAARRRQDPTHFLSIPLSSPVIQDNFHAFKQSVLDSCKSGKDFLASIFQNPVKLHLTLGTMVLLDDSERENARKILEASKEAVIRLVYFSVRNNLMAARNLRAPIAEQPHPHHYDFRPILNREPLYVKMQGIEYMNDDPSYVDVLYAKVSSKDGSSRVLQQLADGLVGYCVANGIMDKEYENVKLHATLMNTIFNRKQHSGGAGSDAQRTSFNARDILRDFRDYDFGECKIPEIHLSQRHSHGKDGYYTASTKILLQG